jgi:hypothetical protein
MEDGGIETAVCVGGKLAKKTQPTFKIGCGSV